MVPQLGLELGASKGGKSELAQSEVLRKNTRPALLWAPEISTPSVRQQETVSGREIHSTLFDNHSSQKLKMMPDASHPP